MKNLYFIATSLLITISANAQNNMRPSAYYQDMHFYNAASIPDMGDSDQRLILYNKTRLIPENDGIYDTSPTTYINYLNINEENNTYFSVGYLNDNYSFFSRNSLSGGYGKKYNLGEKSTITIGGRLVLHTDLINWDNFKLPHNESGRSFGVSPDLDLGVQFQWKGFRLGASTNNMIGLSKNLDDAAIITSQRSIVINTSYDFNINENIILSPYVLLYTELNTVIDLGLYFNLYKTVHFSYLLRVNELRSIGTVEAKLYKGFSLGLAYDNSPLKPDNSLDLFVRYFF